jgi:hypothetical protein
VTYLFLFLTGVMADLNAALTNPAFGPVPASVEVGKDGRPVDPQAVFKMPE